MTKIIIIIFIYGAHFKNPNYKVLHKGAIKQKVIKVINSYIVINYKLQSQIVQEPWGPDCKCSDPCSF